MISNELQHFSSRLYEYSDKLTASDEIIARYIVNNPEKVTRMKIKDVTDKLYVSKASLVRFCQKLGYDGFIDLKNQLKLELIEENDEVLTEGTENNSMIELINDYKKILNRYLKFVKEKDLEELIEAIAIKEDIIIYGVGSFSILAEEFAIRLKKVGILAQHITYEYEMELIINHLKPNSMVIALSQKCSELYLINLLKKLNRNNIFTYLITSYGNPNIKKLSSKSLILPNLVYLKTHNLISPSFILIVLIDLVAVMLIKNYNKDITNEKI